MKVVVKKRQAESRPRTPATSAPRAAPAKARDNTAWIKWAVIATLALAIGGAAAASAAARHRRAAAMHRAQPAKPQAVPSRPGQVPGGILGDIDLKAWCKENDKNNPELQARRARMHGGAQPAPMPSPTPPSPAAAH